MAEATPFRKLLLNHEVLIKAHQLVNELGGDLECGLRIADELQPLNCDMQTIAAGMIFPTLYQQNFGSEQLQKYISVEVIDLALGVQKMDAIEPIGQDKKGLRADNLRKMCLAMVDDVRIVVIKLAERLALLKWLKQGPLDQQQKIAQQIAEIYAPLANRLGLGHIKWQMEDWSFRYLNPTEYKKISKALNMRRQDREIFIHNFIMRLLEILKEGSVRDAEITGRAKHIFSIYRKIYRKKIDFSQIYDTSAVRILVKTIEDCYKALSIVHSTWSPIAPEFDDYIAKPKPNGYRSIHTVVIGPSNINVEIQIRTFQMHEESELGVAAHWQYKEGGKISNYAEKINWLRHIMDWQKEVSSSQENLYRKIFEDRVYVFTPNGDVFDLETGATALDFAYHVHSNLGHRCRGAKVNDMIVPLNQPLRTGDQVFIIAGKEIIPSRDWLNPAAHYLKTSEALHKVRYWFKKQEQSKYLTIGQEQWEKLAKRESVPKSLIEKALPLFKFKSLEELYITIGSGTLGAISVLNRIRPGENKKEAIIDKIVEKTFSFKTGEFHLEGTGNLLTQLARCCKPIPGDAILGYITKGRGISIHLQACKNIQYISKRHPERLFLVNWGKETKNIYPVEIQIEADDRAGLVRDITNIIATHHISLLGLSTNVNKLNNLAHIKINIEINNLDLLNKIQQQISQIDGVIRIQRS